MTNPPPSAVGAVVIHLLDSAQGHSLQTWRFSACEVITIGRNDDNDINIADPQVSRYHAKLILNNGAWSLVSLGRHGTLVDDRVVSEVTLHDQTTLRLGSGGPLLRLEFNAPELRRSETIDNIYADMFSMLEVDEVRKQQEVNEITENLLFRELQEQSRRIKSADVQPPNST